jgi:peptidoglycan/LPS O-acetylase OafA/YrhL
MRAERIVPNPSTSPGAAARPANSAAAEHADGAVNTNARGKIGELESVRGVAALLIVFYHMPVWHGALYGLKFVRNSYLMVDLFFVLSGFVINLNYGERLTSAKSLGRFQLLRLGRLYPVHLIFLLLFLLLETGKWVAATKYNVTAPNGRPFEKNSLHAFVEQLFLVQALGLSSDAETFNTPSWSISVEFYTYLLFGVMCLTLGKMFRQVAFGILAVASICVLVLVADFGGNFSPILRCLTGFFVGCLTATLSNRVTRTFSALPALTTLAALIAFLCLKVQVRSDWIIYFLSATLILTIVHAREGWFRAILRSRPLAYLGLISYSLYMSHAFVLFCCNQFIRVILKRPEAMTAGTSFPQLTGGEACASYFVALGVTIALSSIVFRLVEDPCRRKSRAILLSRSE